MIIGFKIVLFHLLYVCKVVFDLVTVLVNLVKSLMFLEGLF